MLSDIENPLAFSLQQWQQQVVIKINIRYAQRPEETSPSTEVAER